MPVLKEYFCYGHGRFESDTPVCPLGCTLIEQRFYTPPGIHSPRTKNLDSTLNTIAKDFGLSDMNNDHGHGAARVLDGRTKKLIEQQNAMREHLSKKFSGMKMQDTRSGTGGWGSVARGGVFQQGGNVVEKQRGPGAPATVSGVGAQADHTMSEVLDSAPKPRVIAKRDPDGASSIARVKAA